MPEISPTGKWIDTKTGQVVDSEPAEGRLLVAPGGAITPNVKADIDAANEQAPVTEKDNEVETASEPEKVETATADDKTKTRTTTK